jgi:hypothetical protein
MPVIGQLTVRIYIENALGSGAQGGGAGMGAVGAGGVGAAGMGAGMFRYIVECNVRDSVINLDVLRTHLGTRPLTTFEPYVGITLNGNKILRQKTSSFRSPGRQLMPNASWNQTLHLPTNDINDMLDIELWDDNLFVDTFLGFSTIPLSSLLQQGQGQGLAGQQQTNVPGLLGSMPIAGLIPPQSVTSGGAMTGQTTGGPLIRSVPIYWARRLDEKPSMGGGVPGGTALTGASQQQSQNLLGYVNVAINLIDRSGQSGMQSVGAGQMQQQPQMQQQQPQFQQQVPGKVQPVAGTTQTTKTTSSSFSQQSSGTGSGRM